MLSTLKENRSLTFYQPTSIPLHGLPTTEHVGGLTSVATSTDVHTTAVLTQRFVNQCNQYLRICQEQQQNLLNRTNRYIQNIYDTQTNPTATHLRDKGHWNAVQRLVDREELMKLQISQKTDLPMTPDERQALFKALQGKNLADMKDVDIKDLLDTYIKRDERAMLDALKDFKSTGRSSHLLQQEKLDKLQEELANIDLSKISPDEFKYLKENYCERIEYHHRTSISNNPSKQSLADNISPLATSEHDKRHLDPKTGKVNYKQPVEDTELNRLQEIRDANRQIIFRNEIKGLGLAAAIGAGVGFTLGFATTLAQSGTDPDSIRMALGSGVKSGMESGLISTIGYGVGRTVGQVAVSATTGLLANLGVAITDNIARMCSMGVVGILTISVFSVYQFAKLKMQGVDTRKALIQVGKQAAFSLSLLVISLTVQGILGGAAGIIVSGGIGFCIVSYFLISTACQRQFAEELQIYMIEKCKPVFITWIDCRNSKQIGQP